MFAENVRLSWQPKLPYNFHKNIHVCNGYIDLNNPVKN